MSRAGGRGHSFKGELEMMATNGMRILSERISHSVGFIGLKLLELLSYTADDRV